MTAFEHVRHHHIASLELDLDEYQHRKTGAMHYHFKADNEENVFLVAFRTVPEDGRGVAHILEHTVLCGSEKYPVRDPFFLMLRRSLNTFMNAFTSSDYTAYPFSSANRKDYFNLLDIYLDAVFFSRLDPLDFAQEGHRIEFEEPDDPNTPLVYRGVVYNEMKGDSSSPVSVLYEAVQKAVFPTNTYHYNSGGDPLEIPSLTYEQLQAFYQTHYHPSNAIFMTYGDIPVEEHQSRIESQALSRFDRLSTDIHVPLERRYAAPVAAQERYAVEKTDDMMDKHHVVVSWLLGPAADLDMRLKCQLLSDVLLDTSASPLRRALESSELGKAVSPLTGLEDSTREMTFMCGLEGCRESDVAEVEALILSTLTDVVDTGITQDRLDAVLHQLELHQREIGGDGGPYGLQLMMSSLSAAVHGGDPVTLLDMDASIEQLREEILHPDFIPGLVKSLLLDNGHRVRLHLKPDTALSAEHERIESDRLAAFRADLDDQGVQHLVDEASRLKERQEMEEDLSVLPRVGLADISHSFRYPQASVSQINGYPLTTYEAGTNGLLYHQILHPLPPLSFEDLPLLPIYANVISELGAGDKDYLTTQHDQHSLTGGVSGFSSLRARPSDTRKIQGYFTLSSKCLSRNVTALVDLVGEIASAARFDEHERLLELVNQMRARREGGITGNGHGLAMLAASAGMAPASWLNHEVSGLAGLLKIRDLDNRLSSGEIDLGGRLTGLHEQMQEMPHQFLLVGDTADIATASSTLGNLWHAGQGQGDNQFQINAGAGLVNQFWTVNTQVNFCAAAFPTVAENHSDSAALSVLAGVLRNGFLHRVLREQGGAYGGGAGHDSMNGVFRFFSYRDPQLMQTFNAFDESLRWLCSEKLEFDAIEESILSIIASIDAPGSPAGEARQAFHNELTGRDADYRRQTRDAILAVSVEDVKRVAVEYLLDKDCSRVAVTHQDAVTEANQTDFEVIDLS